MKNKSVSPTASASADRADPAPEPPDLRPGGNPLPTDARGAREERYPGSTAAIRANSSKDPGPAAQDVAEQPWSMVDAMPQIVWTAQPEGQADYFNQRWFEFTGLGLEQSQNTGWLSMVHPEDAPNCIQSWDHAVRTGEPFQAEFRLKRVTPGDWRWHLGRALPVRSLDGRLLKWVGTCTDIQEQKVAEEKLRKSEARTRSLVDATYDAFILTDADGRIADLNRQAELMFGQIRGEAKGKSLAETILPEHCRAAYITELKRSLAAREGPLHNRPIELAALRSKGEEFHVEINLSVLQTDEGVLVCSAI